MTISIRRDFHIDLANIVASEIQYKRSNYYYFIGKVEPWNGSDTPPIIPDLNSEYENTKIRANAMFMKRITAGDISFVTTRFNWESGLVYDVWDHTVNMVGKQFYIVTSTNDVYKCLSNNGGAMSTVEPFDKSFYYTRTNDGYIWKYMYSIPAFKVGKFMSPDYVPVQTSLADNFYNKGAVNFVNIINGGSGYTTGLATTVSVSGNLTGSGASGYITVGSLGSISSVVIENGGSGYTSGVKIKINTLYGTGAVLEPVIDNGIITSISVLSGGVGYEELQTLDFILGGASVAVGVNEHGSISSVKIIDGGIGYDGDVDLIVNSTTGSGLYEHPSAMLSAVMYKGSIRHVNIVDPGIGLNQQLATTITVTGDGTGASFTPMVHNGKIVDVIVDSAGSDYTTMKLNVIGLGINADIVPVLTSSDYTSTQSIVEQTAVMGAIYHVNVVNGGNNYSPYTTVTVTGDGTGAAAELTIVSGVVTKVTMTSFGSGYTYASLIISDPYRTLVGDVVDVSAYPCLPPIKGHGYDAVSELFGETLVINSSLRQESFLNSLLQDYRQFGIIKNPTEFYTSDLYTGNSSLIAYTAYCVNVDNINIDEVLLLGTSKFRVVGVEGNNVTLQSLGTKIIQPVGILSAESDTTRTYKSLRIVSQPSVNKYSGRLLYVSDESPFSFTPDQGIVIKTFLKF